MSRPSFVESGFSSNSGIQGAEITKRARIGDVIQVFASAGAAPFPGEFEI